MARFGYLYLNGGNWEGQQLIPESYVQSSIHPQSAGGPPGESAYGLLWWVTMIEDYAAFFAAGIGGQYIYVIPDIDLLVVISGAPGYITYSLTEDFFQQNIHKMLK
jgi:CubicO group peptidase (beta-lactamase class C family)